MQGEVVDMTEKTAKLLEKLDQIEYELQDLEDDLESCQSKVDEIQLMIQSTKDKKLIKLGGKLVTQVYDTKYDHMGNLSDCIEDKREKLEK